MARHLLELSVEKRRTQEPATWRSPTGNSHRQPTSNRLRRIQRVVVARPDARLRAARGTGRDAQRPAGQHALGDQLRTGLKRHQPTSSACCSGIAGCRGAGRHATVSTVSIRLPNSCFRDWPGAALEQVRSRVVAAEPDPGDWQLRDGRRVSVSQRPSTIVAASWWSST